MTHHRSKNFPERALDSLDNVYVGERKFNSRYHSARPLCVLFYSRVFHATPYAPQEVWSFRQGVGTPLKSVYAYTHARNTRRQVYVEDIRISDFLGREGRMVAFWLPCSRPAQIFLLPPPFPNVLSERKPEIPAQTEISRPHSSVSGRRFARTRNGVPENLFQSDM